jgi:hypothetical protein
MVSKGISVTMKVKGNSMLPFIIGDSDSVVLEKAKNHRVRRHCSGKDC